MEKPLESRLRTSKSVTPPKLPALQPHTAVGVTNSSSGVLGRPASDLLGHASPSPELSDKPRLHKHRKHHHGHAPVIMSKSVSPPTRAHCAPPPVPPTSSSRSYLSATNSDATPPQPAPRMRAPPLSGTVISSQPTIPMALSTEKSKLLEGPPPGGHAPMSSSDKDCSYVKFPRKTSHEYSYPKLIDAYRHHDNTKKGGVPPPLPAATPPMDKSVIVGTASSSTTSSGASKKSRRSLPSLVFSCHTGGGAGHGGGAGELEDDSSRASLSPLGLSDVSTSHLCVHCRKSYNPSLNSKGVCRYAPNDWARSTIETMTCLSCARCLLYHCISDPEEEHDEIQNPCECYSGNVGFNFRRWLGLSLLSILVPCLCCYPPLIACYRAAAACRICGGRHEPSKGQLS